jgi:hypothetical protein
MKAFLLACLILAAATVAEAGHNGNLRVVRLNSGRFAAVDNCGNLRSVRSFNSFNRGRSFSRFGNRQFNGGGGSTVVIERRNGFFGIGGRERTIIQN